MKEYVRTGSMSFGPTLDAVWKVLFWLIVAGVPLTLGVLALLAASRD